MNTESIIMVACSFLIMFMAVLMGFALFHFVKYGLLVGFLAGVIGWIWGLEGGMLLFGKWGFLIGFVYAVFKQKKEALKIFIGLLAGFFLSLLLNWIFKFTPAAESAVMLVCVIVGASLMSAEFASGIAWGAGVVLEWLFMNTDDKSESSSSTSSGGSSGGGSSGGGGSDNETYGMHTGGYSKGSSSSTSCIEEYPGSKGVNPYERYNPNKGKICGNCKYWSGGKCERHGQSDYIAYNLHACWEFEQ